MKPFPNNLEKNFPKEKTPKKTPLPGRSKKILRPKQEKRKGPLNSAQEPKQTLPPKRPGGLKKRPFFPKNFQLGFFPQRTKLFFFFFKSANPPPK